jgi:hypothetical protein
MKPRDTPLPALMSAAVLVFLTAGCKSPIVSDSVIVGDSAETECVWEVTLLGGRWPAAISGDRIVWQEATVVDRTVYTDIYLYDLATQTELRITETGTACCPSISGDRIVWRDNSRIYFRDLNTQSEIRIGDGSASIPSEAAPHELGRHGPVISGDWVVWVDKRGPNPDRRTLYAYNLRTQIERQIATIDARVVLRFDISGDRVVWEGLFVYDLQTQEKTKLHDWGGTPAISGDRIVWGDLDRTTGRGHIYLYELETQRETRIVSDIDGLRAPKISGDLVVYYGGGDGGGLFVHDLRSQSQTRVNGDLAFPDHKFIPDISGHRVLWWGYDVATHLHENLYLSQPSPECFS